MTRAKADSTKQGEPSPSSDDSAEPTFHLEENDEMNALVDVVVANIRRTSSGVFATVEPVTKKHRVG